MNKEKQSTDKQQQFKRLAWLTLAIISVGQIYQITWLIDIEPNSVFGGWGNLLVLYAGVLGLLAMAMNRIMARRK